MRVCVRVCVCTCVCVYVCVRVVCTYKYMYFIIIIHIYDIPTKFGNIFLIYARNNSAMFESVKSTPPQVV